MKKTIMILTVLFTFSSVAEDVIPMPPWLINFDRSKDGFVCYEIAPGPGELREAEHKQFDRLVFDTQKTESGYILEKDSVSTEGGDFAILEVNPRMERDDRQMILRAGNSEVQAVLDIVYSPERTAPWTQMGWIGTLKINSKKATFNAAIFCFRHFR